MIFFLTLINCIQPCNGSANDSKEKAFSNRGKDIPNGYVRFAIIERDKKQILFLKDFAASTYDSVDQTNTLKETVRSSFLGFSQHEHRELEFILPDSGYDLMKFMAKGQTKEAVNQAVAEFMNKEAAYMKKKRNAAYIRTKHEAADKFSAAGSQATSKSSSSATD